MPKQLGKYQIVQPLAVGGMAEIYLARAIGIEGFEKYVVVKRILREHATDARFVAMFLDEARLAASLHHQNIAQVYDIGKANDDYFFAMEYLHGKDVRDLLNELIRRSQSIPLEHVLSIVIGVCSALHYAHTRKNSSGEPLEIIHRDISPSNIVVTYDGGVKLVDFGVARASSDERQYQTQTGSLKGKIPYMSPEQCLGDDIDLRTDIFSVGVVLYEMTTMSRLFRSTGVSDYRIMEAIVHDPIPDPKERVPGYPPGLERIVRKCLAKKPDGRYQDCRSLQLDLEAFAARQALPLSSAGLSQFLEEMVGVIPEPWIELEERGTLPPARLDSTISYVDLTSHQQDPPGEPTRGYKPNVIAVASSISGEVANRNEVPDSLPKLAPRRSAWTLRLGVASILIGGAIGLAAALRSDDEPPAPADPPATPVAKAPAPKAPPKTDPVEPPAPPAPKPKPAEVVEITPDPSVELRFDGKPAGARITIDGTVVEDGKITMTVDPKWTYQIVVEKDGYIPKIIRTKLADTRELHYKLERIPRGRKRPSAIRDPKRRKNLDVEDLRDLEW